MNYFVTVEIETREGVELDALQREDASSLLSGRFSQVEGISRPNDIEIEFTRYWAGAHPGGVIVKLYLDAPELESAEDAAHALVEEALEYTDLLGEWQVAKCEVALNDELALASLGASEGPDAPPADPQARTAQQGHVSPEPDPQAIKEIEETQAEMRALLLQEAERLQCFDLTVFGHHPDDPDIGVDEETARLAAGSLLSSISVLIDHLLEDIETLCRNGGTVADIEGFFVLDELPFQHAHKYTPLLVQKLMVAAVTITGRLLEPQWHGPSSVAESLALHLLISAAKMTLRLYELLDESTADMAYSEFIEYADQTLDFESLYDPGLDGIDEDPSLAHLGIQPMDVESWFLPYPTAERPLHPYAQDRPLGERTT